jgi:monoamine oxidase
MNIAFRKFINVDGAYGRKLIPFPHDPHFNPDVAIYDKMSFADRFAQVGDEFAPTEREMFETYLSTLAGGTMENSSLFELIRWWALSGYDNTLMTETQLVFKFRCGQSGFARHFFDEALASKNLSYKFDTDIASVNDLGSRVVVVDKDGQKYQAKRVVSTIPLNVLKRVSFNPPLNAGKQAAALKGHVNKNVKAHVECANPELRSFSGIASRENPLNWIFGDGTTPAGNTHLVSFGASGPDGNSPLYPEKDIDRTIAAFKKFAPNSEMDVKRVVFHNW